MSERVPIRKLSSGVPGFDEVLGGGIPELSLNLIVGSAGSGKTTLGHQIMFANARPDAKALFFTVLGEPPLKMLRYQQQFSFFDAAKVDSSIGFINLGEEAQSEGGLTKVLSRIIEEVDRANPRIVVVDSFRAMVRRTLASAAGELEMQDFMQRLALHLTSCEATTFMLGEYSHTDEDSSVFTVADGIVWLTQAVERNSVVRKLQVVKMRGQGQIPGLQTMRLTDEGVRVYPRILKPDEVSSSESPLEHRLSTGVPVLDEMMGGGLPRGYSLLVAGPSGSGKTVLSNEFIMEGIRAGEPGVIAVFEKRPNDYLHTTPRGVDFARLVEEKRLEIVYLRPLDLSIDETLTALRDAVLRIGAKRAVIDSLSGLELALAPTFREDFRESLYRMVGALTGMGVSVVSTVELPDSYTSLQFSPHGIAFLSDAIVMQRYLELDGQLRRGLAVVKVRGSQHSKDIREYEIDSKGVVVVGEPLRAYHGLLTGAPFDAEKEHAARQSSPKRA
jgi:circadian clock protein KaiC